MEREKIRKLLLAQQEELSLRRDKIHTDISTRHTSKNFSQQTKERENDDVLAMLDQEAQKELAHITLALRRLDTDNFQLCKNCSEFISDERLLAIPSTVHCRKCAESNTQ